MEKSSTNDVKRVEHTPGPWECGAWYLSPGKRHPDGTHYIRDKDCDTVANTTSRDESEANARLIAAAPDLLEALELAVATIDRLGVQRGPFKSGQGTLDVALAAIAKARGQ